MRLTALFLFDKLKQNLKFEQRFEKIREILGYPYVTPISIWQSGIIAMAKDMPEELSLEECISINNEYSVISG